MANSQSEGRIQAIAPRVNGTTVDAALANRRVDFGRPLFADVQVSDFESLVVDAFDSLPACVHEQSALHQRQRNNRTE